ncbi:MAG: tetratricopeptide repeat protein [Nitrospirae bacterium]|nr:tetratricopeptide repeat protein [Nitrospirota bacterium]
MSIEDGKKELTASDEEELISPYIHKYKYISKTEKKIAFFEDLKEKAKAKNATKYELFFEGYIKYLKREFDGAIDKFTGALREDKDFSYPYHGLASVYRRLGEYNYAIGFYNTVTSLNDDFSQSWEGLGRVYDALGKDDKAIEHYKESLELDKDNVYVWNVLGALYSRLRRHKEALECFDEALKLADKYKDDEDVKTFALNYKTKIETQGSNKDIVKEECKTGSPDEKRSQLVKLLCKTENIEGAMALKEKHFSKFLKAVSKNKEDLYFQVLRRWNSYTPIIADNYHISKGGGYFFNVNGFGIVIDPGFNFIENFKGAGHKFTEIDYVFVSHAHNDHTSDIESIITLLYKCNNLIKDTLQAEITKNKDSNFKGVKQEEIEKEFKQRRKVIEFYITKSVYQKYSGMLKLKLSTDYKIHIIDSDFIGEIANVNFKVIEAKHDDIISDRDSVGFVFELEENILIYTGDTGWNEDIEGEYRLKILDDKNYNGKKKLLVAHLGGFKDYEWDIATDETKAFYKNHLGRLGLVRMLQLLTPDICFISEFGEEVGRSRREIAKIFGEVFPRTFFFPADIGLKYCFIDNTIQAITDIDVDKLELIDGYVKPDDVKVTELYKDSSLHYYEANDSLTIEDLCNVLREDYERKTTQKDSTTDAKEPLQDSGA